MNGTTVGVVETEHQIAVGIALTRREPCVRHPGRFRRRQYDGGRIFVDVLAELQVEALDLIGDLLRALALVGRQRRSAVFELLDQVLLERLIDRILRRDRPHAPIQRLALRHFSLERQELLQARLRSVTRRLVGRYVLQQVDRIREVRILN